MTPAVRQPAAGQRQARGAGACCGRTSVKLSGHTCVTAEPKCVQAAQKQKMPSGLCTQLASAPRVKPRYDASLRVTPACEEEEA